LRWRREVAGEAGPAVDLDQQLGQVDLGQARLDELAQPPLVDHLGGGVDEEFALQESYFGFGVADPGEALDQLGLLAGERPQALGAVDRLLDRPGEGGAGLLPVLLGKQEARGVGVPAAAGHPNPSGAQRRA
jgi:hypothetical protein